MLATTEAMGGKNLAKVWDAKTGQHLFDLVGHTLNVSQVAFSPDSQKIVTSSD